MNFLTHSPFLKALGWSLIESLWQFGVIWLLFVLLTHTKKNLSSAIKHSLALILVSGGFAWFAFGLSFRYFSYFDHSLIGASFHNLQQVTSYSFIYTKATLFLDDNLSYLSVFYLLIVSGFFTRFFRLFFYSHSIKTCSLSKPRAELRLYVQQLVQQLDISRKVQVWISEYIDTPMVIGFLRPTILIPLACINQLSVKQVEAILLHELAHIKRNDYLVNLYIASTEILFFFNPFARLLIKAIKQEREKSCDDWVLQFRFDPFQYASALLSLEKSRMATYPLAMAASGTNNNLLLQRIQRILGIKRSAKYSGISLIVYFITIGLLGFIALVNPGEIDVKKIKNSFVASNIQPANTTGYNRIVARKNSMEISKIVEKTPAAKSKISPTPLFSAVDRYDPEENFDAFPVSMDIENTDDQPTITLLRSEKPEPKDFSIKDVEQPLLPEVVAAPNEFPFVPNSSFSYYKQDTTLLKTNPDVNNQQVLQQSLAQTQKAIEELDWEKIARLQKIDKLTIMKLRKEIQVSLQHLNGQQIHHDTSDSLNRENIEKLQIFFKENIEVINNYKSLQKKYESIKIELQRQEEKLKKDVNFELRETQKQVQKRKVIVYI